MPSLRHQALAVLVPRLRGSSPLSSEAEELAHFEARRRREQRPRALPLGADVVRRFARRFEVTTTDAPFPVHVIRPRGRAPRSTVFYVHGGGYVSPADPRHVAYALRLAAELGAELDAEVAEVVLPDYPLAPGADWRASHDVLLDDLARRCAEQERVVLAGDSAGGGIALALAASLRDRGGPQPDRLVLLSPWVDLTTSTPQTYELDAVDPWLQITKLDLYAGWWAGRPEDLARPEVSPALGELAGLPPTLMFCGTRDLLVPGCRLLADRAAALPPGAWDLTYLEAPDLIHVFPLLPVPEARTAWLHTREFLRGPR